MDKVVRVERGALAAQDDVVQALPAIFELSERLLEARGFIPSHYKTSGEVAAAIIAGRELGLPPMLALRSLYVINGKVGLDASLQLALMKRAGIKHRWLADGSDRQTARLRLEHNGEWHEQSFTYQEAEAMGLLKNAVWRTSTAAMLRARCVSAAGKAFCPDIVTGVYVEDEIDNMITNDNTYTTSAAINENPPHEPAQASTVVDAPPASATPAQARPTPRKGNPALDGLMSAIVVIGKDGLAPWHEELDALQGITGAQRTNAWNAWGERCKDFKIDPQAFSNQIRATRANQIDEAIP
jgi:hypothetical protein